MKILNLFITVVVLIIVLAVFILVFTKKDTQVIETPNNSVVTTPVPDSSPWKE